MRHRPSQHFQNIPFIVMQSFARPVLPQLRLCPCYLDFNARSPCMSLLDHCVMGLSDVAACRPEWAPFAQKPGESRAACEDRLRSVFSFSAAAPLPGPLSSTAAVPRLLGSKKSPGVPQTEAGKAASSVASRPQPSCKVTAGSSLGVGYGRSAASAAAGAGPKKQQQQQHRLASSSLMSKQGSAATRPGLKRPGE